MTIPITNTTTTKIKRENTFINSMITLPLLQQLSLLFFFSDSEISETTRSRNQSHAKIAPPPSPVQKAPKIQNLRGCQCFVSVVDTHIDDTKKKDKFVVSNICTIKFYTSYYKHISFFYLFFFCRVIHLKFAG